MLLYEIHAPRNLYESQLSVCLAFNSRLYVHKYIHTCVVLILTDVEDFDFYKECYSNQTVLARNSRILTIEKLRFSAIAL